MTMWRQWQWTARHHLAALSINMLLVLLFCGSLAQSPLKEPIRIGVLLPEFEAPLDRAMVEAARQGAIMAGDEYAFNAQMLGMTLDVLIETTMDAEAVVQAAERLIDKEGVFALIGGFTLEEAEILAELAEERRILFFNIGAASDSLRNEACSAHTFHIAPSAAMYIDALAGWYIRSGFRRWFFVHDDTEESKALYERTLWTLRNRHFGARDVGRSVLTENREFADTLSDIQQADPDLVLMLLGSEAQLAFLREYETSDMEATISGFPHLSSQTREFFVSLLEAAPTANARQRASAWEATLDRYGARELNSRYLLRWEEPMEPSAWAAYQAIKVLYEAAFFRGSLEAQDLISHLRAPQTVFDIWKGIGASFRPWDHQLRQSLYLVTISLESTNSLSLASLVGELPAIYLPGTEPVERLDQLGDLGGQTDCRF